MSAALSAEEPSAGDPRFSIEALRSDRGFFRANCLKIITKEQGLQPFVMNYTQRTIVEAIASLRAQNIPPRIIVLKSRQVGVSTLSEGLLFEDCLLQPYRSSLVIAHTEKAAKGLFRMTRRFNRYLPKFLQIKTRADNVSEIEFPHESRMQVEVEGEVRSMTATGFHGSEVAFWKDAQATLTSALQTMPRSADTLGILESTANGQGNLFHDLWCAAIEGQAKPGSSPWEQGWYPIFIPWWRHEEYMMRPWFLPDETSQEERKIARQFKLTMRHLAWRRWCIKANCHGDPEVFRVEYPSTWQEAFAMSGRPIWPSDQLEHYAKDAPPQKVEGSVWQTTPETEIEWDGTKRISVIVKQPKGRLRVFEPFHPRHSYVLFADPSEGDRKSDPSPIEIIDQMTLNQSAEWWGRVPPDVLAQFAAWLGLYYGGGLLNAEANNHGILFFATLLDMQYPNIWFRTTHEESIADAITEKPGLMQTNKTKHALIDTGRRFVREKRGKIYSPILLGEMATAVYERKEGREVTQITKPAGRHIDAAISWCGALYTHRGSIEAPLLPLPEKDIMSAGMQVALAREKNLEGGDALALELTGMTETELSRLLEMRHQRKMRNERVGRGYER